MIYDIAIIGSGPAGTSAAITCKKNGLKVIVISPYKQYNKNELHPVQSVHPGLLTLMKGLGIENTLLNSVKSKFNGIYVNDQFTALGNSNEEWLGYHLDKPKFDVLLQDQLTTLKIPVIDSKLDSILCFNDGKEIELTTKDGAVYSSKFVIDASGSARKLGRLLNIKELFFSPPLICRTGVSELIDEQTLKTEFASKKNGWVWIAPEDNKQFTWNKLSLNKLDVDDAMVDSSKLLNEIRVYNVRWRAFRPVFRNNILLCGDAAGILDPSAGQGIFNAFLSGIKAGNTVIESVHNPRMTDLFLVQYDQWFILNFEQKIEQLKEHYNNLKIPF